MNKKIFKVVAVFFTICFFELFSILEMQAKNNIPLEGGFDKEDARSVIPLKSVRAYLDGSQIILAFNFSLSEVLARIIDSEGKVFYSKMLHSPSIEVLQLSYLNNGSYTIELINVYGYMCGEFELIK